MIISRKTIFSSKTLLQKNIQKKQNLEVGKINEIFDEILKKSTIWRWFWCFCAKFHWFLMILKGQANILGNFTNIGYSTEQMMEQVWEKIEKIIKNQSNFAQKHQNHHQFVDFFKILSKISSILPTSKFCFCNRQKWPLRLTRTATKWWRRWPQLISPQSRQRCLRPILLLQFMVNCSTPLSKLPNLVLGWALNKNLVNTIFGYLARWPYKIDFFCHNSIKMQTPTPPKFENPIFEKSDSGKIRKLLGDFVNIYWISEKWEIGTPKPKSWWRFWFFGA